MKSMVRDITLEPLGVPDLHPRSQERPPKSGSVPDCTKSNFFNFEDKEESYKSNCMYFEREIH